MPSHDIYRGLEQRFDGEIPDELRCIALAGGHNAFDSALAQANSRCCDRLALTALRSLAWRRGAMGELNTWRREGLAWRDAEPAAARL